MRAKLSHREPSRAPIVSFGGTASGPLLTWLAQGLREVLVAHGYHFSETPCPEARLVLHFVDAANPRPYRRRAQATFVVAVLETDAGPPNILQFAYPILVRSLANLVICMVRRGGKIDIHFVTPELGHYVIPYTGDTALFFHRLYSRLSPLASSRLIIDNEFHPDLPPELWNGDSFTAELCSAGQRLAAMNLLPTPFPLETLLSPSDLRHLRRLFGIGGLSYGNLSARKEGLGFWMSGNGVDKSRLRIIGRDILLVKGFDAKRSTILLSVPPDLEPRRVSVDAIEHWMIYSENPGVGAIIHVHAWMEGVPSTSMNYPCGTLELAQSVAGLVRAARDPSRAIVGQKNHGLTITGPHLADILHRIEGRVVAQVPMS